jgi:hypothetical protein
MSGAKYAGLEGVRAEFEDQDSIKNDIYEKSK